MSKEKLLIIERVNPVFERKKHIALPLGFVCYTTEKRNNFTDQRKGNRKVEPIYFVNNEEGD